MWNTKNTRNGFRGRSEKYNRSVSATRSQVTWKKMFRSALPSLAVQSAWLARNSRL